MFLVLFRLSDRLGRLLVKLSTLGGDRVALFFNRIGQWMTRRTSSGATLSTDSSRIETQIRSLSGLIVILLAGVAALTLWATSPQAQNNPLIRILTIGSTPAPNTQPDIVAGQPGVPSQFRVSSGTIVFSMLAGTHDNLFALASGQSTPVRLTSTADDDRNPVWSPDGQKIAFASHRDGNWEIYILTVATGEIKRLTTDLVYESKPSWSPDSQWLAYEGYAQGNLDVYIIKADSSEGPYPVTRGASAESDPAWTTERTGRRIAYVSNRDGNQDIYIISLDDPREDKALNVTNTPDVNEGNPAWSPDGATLAYSAVVNGIPLIYAVNVTQPGAEPTLVGQGAYPAWSPDGQELAFVNQRSQGDLLLTGQYSEFAASIQAFALPARARDLSWSAATLPQPPQGSLAFAATSPIATPYEEIITAGQAPDSPYRLITLPGVIGQSQAVLSDKVDSSFVALKDAISRAAGWDFLGRLDQVWWPLDRPLEPGQPYQNWHKAARAFDIIQTYNQGNPAQIELVPEQAGPNMTWRLYVRAAVQDGSLGQPLHQLPWDFAARFNGSDVNAYEAGGKLKSSIPAGYYVDFTRLAAIYGWTPAPADPSWRYNWPGVLYWQYEKRDGLDWVAAMRQLYAEADLKRAFSTPTPSPVQEISLSSTPAPTPKGKAPTPAKPSTATPTAVPTQHQ